MEIRPYKLHKEAGVLECQLYSVENSQMDNESRMESLGIYNKSKVHGQPINAVIDLKALGEIMFFLPNRIEIYEDFNFVDATKKDIDRSTKLEFGTRVLRIQGLHKQLVDQIELFLDLELGVLDDLPQEISGYYTTTIELSKPVAETDTEEIKKFKEFINNYKNTDNGDQTIQTT